MRGSIRRRGKRSWLLTLEFGYIRDPETGKAKRVQKYITIRGTKRDRPDVVRRRSAQRAHFTVPKGKTARTIEIAPETVDLLKNHRAHQAKLKMRNRQAYHDNGLVFAKEWSDVGRKYQTIGDPLQINNLGQREFAKLIAAAEVRPITLHGLRHTCATLLLSAGVPPNVVQQRLGHKKVEITLSIYAHVLPGQQREAARRIGSLIYNGS